MLPGAHFSVRVQFQVRFLFDVPRSRFSNIETANSDDAQRTTNVEQRTELEHEPRSENIEA